MYGNGVGVTQDFERAVSLHQKACDGGNMRGCYNLGFMYQNGTGVPQDINQALRLYRQACEGGDEEACN